MTDLAIGPGGNAIVAELIPAEFILRAVSMEMYAHGMLLMAELVPAGTPS